MPTHWSQCCEWTGISALGSNWEAIRFLALLQQIVGRDSREWRSPNGHVSDPAVLLITKSRRMRLMQARKKISIIDSYWDTSRASYFLTRYNDLYSFRVYETWHQQEKHPYFLSLYLLLTLCRIRWHLGQETEHYIWEAIPLGFPELDMGVI